MGRDKVAALSTTEAKKKAEEDARLAAEEAAKAPEVKRRLNRIPSKVHVAKVDKVITIGDGRGKGGGQGGGNGGGQGVGKGGGKGTVNATGGAFDWQCPACLADVFASRNECYKCKTPKSKDVLPASGAASGVKGGGGVGGGSSKSSSSSNSGGCGGVGGGGGARAAVTACGGAGSSVAGVGSSGGSAGADAGGIEADAGAVEPTILLKEWQRLPRQLLLQFTDKQKYIAKPDFQLHRVRGELRCKVKLQPRKDEEVVFYCPVACASPHDGYHKVSLYALIHLTPGVQHHRVLPDPYHDLYKGWLESPPPPPRGADGGSGSGSGRGMGAHGSGAAGGMVGGGGRGAGCYADCGGSRGGRGSGAKPMAVTLSEAGREMAQRAILDSQAALDALSSLVPLSSEPGEVAAA